MSRTVPVVSGHFLFGNLPEFRRDRIGLLTRVPREYGDIARLDVGFMGRVVMISAPELVRQVLLEKADSFLKGIGLTTFGRPLLGHGLLTSEGDFHKRQRRMMAPAFMARRIADYADTIAGYTDRAVARLASEHGQVDLSEHMSQLTLEIVGKTLFDADLSDDASDVGDALSRAMAGFNEKISSALPLPPSIPSPGNLRNRRAIRRLDEVVYRMIRERRAAKRDVGDFLSMLLLAQDEDDGSVMTEKQVRDEAMTIMLAGHETTANALSWSFYLLAKHPEVRVRLEAELDAVLAGRRPTVADMPQLPYTLQVFKEAMRLYPPAFMLVRRTHKDVVIGDHPIKQGETVLISIIGMHQRPDLFSDPLKFEPERFAPEREKALPKHAYLPFGLGPRVCIGNHFALMEGQLALAHLAQHLRFELVKGRDEIGYEPLITLRPRGGVHVHVSKRRRDPSLSAA